MIGLRSKAAWGGATVRRAARQGNENGRASSVALLVLAVAIWFAGSGCGSVAYSVYVVRAARSVERAKQVGADKLSPFEMTLARAYLDKAREESAEASYEDAIHFAKLATALGQAAADRSYGKTEEQAPHE